MNISEDIIWGKPQVTISGQRLSIKEEKTVECGVLKERQLFTVNRGVRIIDFSVWRPN